MTDLLLPDPTRTLHAVGDVHFIAANGSGGTPQPHDSWFPRGKKEQVLLDCQMLADAGWVPRAFLQIGDAVEATGMVTQGASEDAMFNAWYASMWPTLDASRRRNITGNHDLAAFSGGVARSAAVAEAALGIANHRDVLDIGFAKVLCLNQDGPTTTGVIPAGDLTWLDTTLQANSGSECWIAYHHPLMNTVGGPTSGNDIQYSTTPADTTLIARGPNATDDTEIRAVLAAHDNAKAWLSGHTHSAIYVPSVLDASQPGIVMPVTVGSHVLAHINLSAIVYVGQAANVNKRQQPVRTALVTKPATGADRIEVRFRDHGLHAMASVNRQRVLTVNL